MADRFDPSKPARKESYPESFAESKTVLKRMKRPDMEYFQLTDKSPRKAFMKYMDEQNLEYDPDDLKRVIVDSHPILMRYKDYYNRPRPNQVNPNIQAYPSETSATPAYPSGHAFQSYLLAKHLSRKYPLHYFSFYSIANRIAKARVSLGLHYPSDNRKAFELAHRL